MQITCPCCNARYPLDAALQDVSAREAVATALRIPGNLGELVLSYISLFRPVKRSLSWKRAARLLRELQGMIHAAEIERNGRYWAAPREYWESALEQMLARRDRLTLPLTGHGYLLEIIAGMSNQVEARREAQEEERKIRQARERRSPSGPAAAASHVSNMTDAKKAAHSQALKDALKGK